MYCVIPSYLLLPLFHIQLSVEAPVLYRLRYVLRYYVRTCSEVRGLVAYLNNGLSNPTAPPIATSMKDITTDFRMDALAVVDFFFNRNVSLSVKNGTGCI
ncbi:MAG: hypothetical protein M1469_06190 [Bacteroidetes bacterium]|nr:hypothetical protein [Bacteroidota bacterium]